jgi:hypothetical protein
MVKSIGTLASESSVGYVYKRWSLVFAIIGSLPGLKRHFSGVTNLPTISAGRFTGRLHGGMNFPNWIARHVLSPVRLIFGRVAEVPKRFADDCHD